jgi:predicted permease
VRLMQVDRGFEIERISSVRLNLPAARYANLQQRTEFFRALIEQARAIPGVTYAAVSNMLPLTGEGNNNIVTVEGDTAPVTSRPISDRRLVSEDYFKVMGIPLLSGRIFAPPDNQRMVAVLSAITAARLYPGQDPLGKKLHFGDEHAPLVEVIGIGGDVRGGGLQKDPALTTYLPYWQRDQRDMSLAIRSTVEPSSLANTVRAGIRSLDRDLPVPQVKTMREIVSASVALRQFQLTMVLVFAAIALMLASLGIYGVVSYSVAQRRNELGIRMALGATASELRALVLRQGLPPVAIGLAAGLAGALALGRILQDLLFGVKVADPLTMGIVAATLMAVACVACYVPALRATRTDPLTALRYE